MSIGTILLIILVIALLGVSRELAAAHSTAAAPISAARSGSFW